MGPDTLIIGTVIAFVAEFILKGGNYQSAKRTILCYSLMTVSLCSNYIHWINASAEWLDKNASTYGHDFMYTISGWFDYWWMFPIVIVSAFIGGLIGGLIGRAVLKKHFIRSGLI